MRVTIDTQNAGHWFEKICEVLVNIDQATAENREDYRVRILRRRNILRFFVPFLKPLPKNHPLPFTPAMFSDWNLVDANLEWQKSEALRVFHALSDLLTLPPNVMSVTLEDQELETIRRYSK